MPSGRLAIRLPIWRAGASGYALAVAAVAAAFLLRAALMPVLADQAPLVLFLLPVMIAAYFGGVGPGILATALACAAGGAIVLAPLGAAPAMAPDDLLRGALFLVEALLASWLIGSRSRALTTARRALDDLREREQRYELVLAGADAAIWDWDVPNKRVVYSSRWKRLRGVSDDELSDSQDEWVNGIHSDDRERVLSAVNAHFEGRTPVFIEEYRVLHNDGNWIWVRDCGLVRRDAEGRVIRMAGAETDITDRKLAEEALRRSEERYRAIVESQAEMVCRFRSDGKIVFVNGGYARTRDTTPGALIGRNFWEFVAEADRSAVQSMLDRLTPEAPERRIENRFETADGERWTLWTNRALLFDADGRWLEAQSTGIDITERKEAERALQRANRRKNEFIAVLGHELRNPLAPLRAGLDLLHLGSTPELIENVREMMGRQLSHLVRLVDDLLDLSRINRGDIDLQLAPLDLRGVLAAALELTKPLFVERRHVLIVEPDEGPLPMRGDFHRLTQVVGNLLGNAAKYTEAGGTIWLHTEREDGEVLIRVRDTGYGFPPEQHDNLFEMFFQVPEHRALTGGGGLGIGLALSRQVIAMHRGSIGASSKGLGHGSEFVIRLPLAESALVPPVGTVSRAAPARARRILVVDDNVDAAESLCLVLKMSGHEVTTVHEAALVAETVDRFDPEVVLLDIGLPEMDGYEVARRIRSTPRGKNILLVAVTGWGQEEDKQHAREAGFDEHLVKPVDPALLRTLIAAESESKALYGADLK